MEKCFGSGGWEGDSQISGFPITLSNELPKADTKKIFPTAAFGLFFDSLLKVHLIVYFLGNPHLFELLRNVIKSLIL